MPIFSNIFFFYFKIISSNLLTITCVMLMSVLPSLRVKQFSLYPHGTNPPMEVPGMTLKDSLVPPLEYRKPSLIILISA